MNNYFKVIINANGSINDATFNVKVPSELSLSKMDLASILKNYLYSEEYRIHISGTRKTPKDALSLKELKSEVLAIRLYREQVTTGTFWKDDLQNIQVFTTPEHVVADHIERVVYEEKRTWSFFAFKNIPMASLDMEEVLKYFAEHGVKLKKAASSTKEVTYYCCAGGLYIEDSIWTYVPQTYAYQSKVETVIID